eukprot:397679-Rhodomonas_salina.1
MSRWIGCAVPAVSQDVEGVRWVGLEPHACRPHPHLDPNQPERGGRGTYREFWTREYRDLKTGQKEGWMSYRGLKIEHTEGWRWDIRDSDMRDTEVWKWDMGTSDIGHKRVGGGTSEIQTWDIRGLEVGHLRFRHGTKEGWRWDIRRAITLL